MYTVTITKTEVVETLTNSSWEQGGPDGANEDGTWGYTPQIPQKTKQTQTVLEMKVDNLDVAPVVNAILEHGDTA